MLEAEILKLYRTVAIVGLSANEAKPSNSVGKYLSTHGFKVIPVNPGEKEILTFKSYPDLVSIPDKVEIVDIFRKSEDSGPIVDEAIKIGARVIWMQEGIKNDEAAKKAEMAGLKVVMDKCMKKTHQKLTRMKLL
jgi:uncharacterized protein